MSVLNGAPSSVQVFLELFKGMASAKGLVQLLTAAS
jgi:hypothetical protein